METTCLVGGDDDPFLLLHEDFLIQILVRLPIRSLLRCKSVCKSWRDLIQTSFFTDLHTTFNTSSTFSSKLGGTFIFQGFSFTDNRWHKFTGGGGGVWHWDSTNCGRYWVSDGRDWLWDDTNRRWYWVGDGDDQEELFKVDDDDNQLVLKLDNLELPSCYKSTYREDISGSCNGLVCLYDSELRDVSLWNPATRQFRRLPKPTPTDDSCSGFVAFGFDVKTKDYKVLLITFRRVQVYSLCTDSWRLLEGVSQPMPDCHHGLYLNGSCFFLANVYHPESNTKIRFINSFDFTKEIFTTIQIPDHHHRQRLFLYCLGGEKMALFTTLRKTPSGYLYKFAYDDDDPDGYDDCDIWALNEQGCCGGGVNKESWTKLHSFQIKNTRQLIPRGISNNGKFAILETTGSSYAKSMQLYNLVTKEAAKMDFLPCQIEDKVSTADVYKPSLVSIIGGNGNGAAAARR